MALGFEFVGQDSALNTGGETAESHDASENIGELRPKLRVRSQEIGWNIVITSKHSDESEHGCDGGPASDGVLNAVFQGCDETLHDVLIWLRYFIFYGSFFNCATLVSGTLFFVLLKPASDRLFDEKQGNGSDEDAEGAHGFEGGSPSFGSDDHDAHTAESRTEVRPSSDYGVGSGDLVRREVVRHDRVHGRLQSTLSNTQNESHEN